MLRSRIIPPEGEVSKSEQKLMLHGPVSTLEGEASSPAATVMNLMPPTGETCPPTAPYDKESCSEPLCAVIKSQLRG